MTSPIKSKVTDYFTYLIKKNFKQHILFHDKPMTFALLSFDKKEAGVVISQQAQHNKDFENPRRMCEQAKRAMSNQHQVHVEIECLDLSVPLTRACLEETEE
ncbi:hypothetical protein C5167_014941 [Papaver somniferum]|uniref:Uncharacterized protein n=1 Tax=Papaver somniferum TaxID=3469 RepID=A0A4Y7J4L3_PAPSO|nr:hypothetical protein C5167_014941 [Papaver somniferum]